MRRRHKHAVDPLVRQVAASLESTGSGKSRIVAGLSGGIDSVVLLHALRQGLKLPAARLSAIHVNHRISAHAQAWAAHCRRYCRDLGVPLKVVGVDVPRGNSTEAAAREARYAVFADSGAEVVALAHNRDDQAETLLLQLLRGAGPRGLAAMPEIRKGSPALWRPLLEVPRDAIASYAERHGLRWIDDDSNRDTAYTRNFLRLEVIPLIERQIRGARAVLSRAARLQAEAATLLDDLARLDLGTEVPLPSLPLEKLRGLSPSRQRNVLRFFLRGRGLWMPDAARLDEALRQITAAREDARVCVETGDVEIRRFGGAVHVVARQPPPPNDFRARWINRKPLPLPVLGGELRFERRPGEGIAAGWLRRNCLTVRLRRGGERLRLAPAGGSRSLRNLLQEAGLPPWQRDRLPLLYLGDELAAVPGLGVDIRFRAIEGETGWFPLWLTD